MNFNELLILYYICKDNLTEEQQEEICKYFLQEINK